MGLVHSGKNGQVCHSCKLESFGPERPAGSTAVVWAGVRAALYRPPHCGHNRGLAVHARAIAGQIIQLPTLAEAFGSKTTSSGPWST